MLNSFKIDINIQIVMRWYKYWFFFYICWNDD